MNRCVSDGIATYAKKAMLMPGPELDERSWGKPAHRFPEFRAFQSYPKIGLP